MSDNIKVVSIGNKMIKLIIKEFDTEINVEDILRIDYANILGEILTFPLILNRLGIFLADIEDYLRREEFELEKDKDDLDRKRAIAETSAFKELKKTINSPTKAQIENTVRLDKKHQKDEEKYRGKKLALLDIRRDRDYVNSLYWSAKSKDTKLDKMTDKLRPDEFQSEILDGMINGVLIKVTDKLIQ